MPLTLKHSNFYYLFLMFVYFWVYLCTNITLFTSISSIYHEEIKGHFLKILALLWMNENLFGQNTIKKYYGSHPKHGAFGD